MNSDNKKIDRQDILKGIYQSSMGISQTTLAVVAALEIFMLIYTLVNPALYGPHIWKYRMFYIALLGVALTVIMLNRYVKKDIENQFSLPSRWNLLSAPLTFIMAVLSFRLSSEI